MNKFLVKIAYKDEGYSVWRHEAEPIPLYHAEESAYQQACAIFCREIDFSKLDTTFSNQIINLISSKNYKKAICEINFSNTIKFSILESKESTASQPIIPGSSQLQFNFNAPIKGATCRKCSYHNDHATPDGTDGKHTCYACKV